MREAENTDYFIGNGMLNRIIDNAYRGIMSNYKGIPIDCPQRDERGENIVWEILIPANTTGEAHLPNGEVRQLASGRYQLRF